MAYITSKLTSRKFWALIAAVAAAVAGMLSGTLDVQTGVLAIAAAAGTYQLGEGIADHGKRQ